MNRRGFLHRLGVGIVVLTLARQLPGIAPAPVVGPPSPQVVTLQKGDMFTIEGEFAMHPVTGAQTGHLRYFTVMADIWATEAIASDVIWPRPSTPQVQASEIRELWWLQ